MGKKLHMFLAKHNVLSHCLKSCEKYGCDEYHGSSPMEQISFYTGKGLTSFGTEVPECRSGMVNTNYCLVHDGGLGHNHCTCVMKKGDMEMARYQVKLRNEPAFEVEGEVYLFNSSEALLSQQSPHGKVNEQYAISLNADDVVFIKKLEDKEEQNIMYFTCGDVKDAESLAKNIEKALRKGGIMK
jgi:hypothetical protein